MLIYMMDCINFYGCTHYFRHLNAFVTYAPLSHHDLAFLFSGSVRSWKLEIRSGGNSEDHIVSLRTAAAKWNLLWHLEDIMDNTEFTLSNIECVLACMTYANSGIVIQKYYRGWITRKNIAWDVNTDIGHGLQKMRIRRELQQDDIASV